MKKIQLNHGKAALVDDEDFDWLSQFKWRLFPTGTGYACRRVNRRVRLMHRDIMGPDSPFMIDHIDGDGLNNQRSNLRFATSSVNQINSRRFLNRTGQRGISYCQNRSLPWMARITHKKKLMFIGRYKTLAEAVEARKKSELEIYGMACPSR